MHWVVAVLVFAQLLLAGLNALLYEPRPILAEALVRSFGAGCGFSTQHRSLYAGDRNPFSCSGGDISYPTRREGSYRAYEPHFIIPMAAIEAADAA